MTTDNNFPARGFRMPPPAWRSNHLPPVMPASERKPISTQTRADIFNELHNLPADDSPYGRAKHVQGISGGPLINLDGEVGVHVMTIKPGLAAAAVPIDSVLRIMERFNCKGRDILDLGLD